MAATVVVGMQWGDEGKGKVVDYLSSGAQAVVRFQGGANAGHTIVNDFGEFRLHLMPSGIFRPGVLCLLGTGTVVDTASLLAELADLQGHGISVDSFRLSDRAQIVLPPFLQVEEREEELRGGSEIGTTGRGIGPAYATKAARFGVQAGDLLDHDRLRKALDLLFARYRAWLGLDAAEARRQGEALFEELCVAGERLAPYILDAAPLLAEWISKDTRVMMEGQLGVMRDLDWGIYPYVTSSNPTAGGACAAGGIPPRFVKHVTGVVKAYTTAVGAGPVPTEDHGAVGRAMRERGGEIGATTGRPRRCGWLDLVAVRYACLLNGTDKLAVTKLDVLDEFEELQVCVKYRSAEGEHDLVPQARLYEKLEPVYVTMPGWRRRTRDVRRMEDLPAGARAYLDLICEQTGTPLELVSVGPHRDHTVYV